MGFAAGMRAGMDMGDRAVNAYKASARQAEIDKIADAKPVESQGFTAQDGEQLAAIANAKKADGTPYYTLGARPDGTYDVTPNFDIQNDAGQMEPAKGVGIAQRRVTDFLGSRYDADSLTPERIQGLRDRAMADVVSRYDPVQGLAMRQNIRQGEREDEKFGWEKQAQPLVQRGNELKVAGAERTERKGALDEETDTLIGTHLKAYKGTADQIGPTAQFLNTTSRSVTMGMPDKNGIVPLSLVRPDGQASFLQLSKADQAQLYAAGQIMEKNPQRALDMIGKVNKELAGVIAAENKTTVDATNANNNGAYHSGALGLQAQRNAIAAQQAQNSSYQLYAPQQGYQVGPDGQMTPTITGLQLNKRGGGLEPVSVPLQGQNFIPAAALAPEKLAKVAEQIVGQPTGRLDAAGKPEKFTPETAMAAARNQVIRSYAGQQGGANQVRSVADAILSKAAAPASPAAQGPGRGLRPPAAAAAPAPNAPISEDELRLITERVGGPAAPQYQRRLPGGY